MKKPTLKQLALSATILVGLVAALNYLGLKPMEIASAIASAASAIFRLLGAVLTYRVPAWALLAVLAMVALLRRWSRQNPPELAGSPEWLQFKDMIYFGVRWEWGWRLSDRGYEIESIRGYCPVANCRGDIMNVPVDSMGEPTDYLVEGHKLYCIACKAAYENAPSPVERAVEAEVLRRIRTRQSGYGLNG